MHADAGQKAAVLSADPHPESKTTPNTPAGPTVEDEEELLLSSRYGDTEDVKSFVLRFGVTTLACARDERGNSALHMLCANGHDETLAYVLSLPGLPRRALRARNSARSTPLHWAAVNMQFGTARLLVEAADRLAASSGASGTDEDELSSDPDEDRIDGDDEATAVQKNKMSSEKSKIKSKHRIRGGGSLVLMKDGSGRTPLGEAESSGWDEGARFFVSVMELGTGTVSEGMGEDRPAEDDSESVMAGENTKDPGSSTNTPVEVDVKDLEGRVASTHI